MSTLALALRRDRISRFLEVARTEGLRRALSLARRKLRQLRAGQVPELVGGAEAAARPAVAPRFALGPAWSELARAGAFHVSRAPAVLARRRSVAMIGDLNLPQCRKYRVEQADELWAEAGADYRYAHYEDLPRCRDMLQGATHLMLYRLGRSDLATMYLYEARRLRLPVLYDIDDPLFSVSAYETYGNMGALPAAAKAHFVAEAPLYLDVMSMADAHSFSTPALAEHAAAYAARPAFVRRNFADRATLAAGAAAMEAAAGRERRGFTVAVASGSRGHEADLATIAGELAAFLDADGARRLLVLGHLDTGMFPAGLRARIAARPFAGYADYLGALAAADCAVMPLADDAFNRCKSAVRAIDAAAAGVVPVAGEVGDFAALIRHGETGLLAGRAGGWRAALEALAADPAETRAMGRRARAALERDWRARPGWPVADPELVRWVTA